MYLMYSQICIRFRGASTIEALMLAEESND
jgi:hypothetical protein